MRVSSSEAISLLKEGRVVAIPTETVYGLAASLRLPTAVSQLFALKGREKKNPITTLIGATEDLQEFLEKVPPGGEALMRSFWPGPMTLVLPAHRVPEEVCAGMKSAGFRLPAHPVAKVLLKEVGPLAVPSANLSGFPSATCVEHVERDFGGDFPVIDGGPCEGGIESTVLAWEEEAWRLLRLGALPLSRVGNVLGYVPERAASAASALPHYSPRCRLVLGRSYSGSPAVVVGFSGRNYPGSREVRSLGIVEDVGGVERALFATLRALDRDGVGEAWVDIDVPGGEEWQPFLDRMKKAAAS